MAETVRIEIPIETIDNTDPELSNITRNFERMEKAASNAGDASKKASQNVSAFDKQAQKTESSLSKWAREKHQVLLEAKDKISPILETAGRGLRSFAGKTWRVTMKAVDLVTAPVRGIINILKNPVFQLGAVLGVSIGLKDTIETYKNFESAMSQVQAISGATSADLDKLTKKAKEMGATTKFTAEESAEAFNYMAMAGWKTDDMLNGIEGILNLAAASGADLATTSDIVTDALTAFGMSASDAGHFSDVMAAASANANTNVTMMGETFKYAGAMAGSLGYSIEDVALMTGLMANSGIKATMSGTALNMIFTRLSTNTGNARDTLSGLGIEFFDSAGKARDLSDVMQELRKATEGMNDEQKSTIANTIAGTQAQKGLLAILNASEEDYRKLQDAIENADGAAANMADTMMDNLSGSITLLQSAVDGVKISFGERLAPYVRSIADWLTAQMPAVEKALDQMMDWVDTKVDTMKRKLQEIMSTTEWQDAGFFGRAKILWDEFIVNPLSEWWNSTGKAKIANFAGKVGNAIGTGLKVGIMTLLGIDISETIDEGVSIGTSFAKGFAEGFDFNMISEKIWQGLGNLLSNASKLLPGGEAADLSSLTSALLLAKLASPLLSLGRGALGIGTMLFGKNAATGTSIMGGLLGSAAMGTGLLGKSAELAINLGAGNLAGGASLSAGALSALGIGAGAGAVVGGTTLVGGALDIYRAIKSDNEDESAMYGKSAAWKIGGTAAGAGIGAAIGSVIPGLGTAVGGLIGAGIGALFGRKGASKEQEEYEAKVEEMRKEAEKAEKVLRTTGISIDKVRFKSETLTQAMEDAEVSTQEFAIMFQEECANVMADAFGDIHLSLTEVKKLASDITFGDMKEGLDEFEDSVRQAETSLNNLQSAASTMKKQNWKVGLGLHLSEVDQSNYKSAVDNFVSAAQQYIDDNHYEATVALKLLLGENADTEGLDKMYQGFTSETNYLSQMLSQAIERALTDGIIDIDEMKVIEAYQKKISDITDKISEAKSEAQLQSIGIKYSGAELDAESFLAMQEELKNYAATAQAGFDEALTLTLTNLNLELSEGAITQQEYDEAVKAATEGYYAQLDEVSLRINDFNLDALANSGFGEQLDKILPYFEGTTKEKLQQAINNVMISHPDTAAWTQADVIAWFGLDKLPAEVANPVADILINSAQANTEATKEQLIESYKECIPSAEEIYASIDWSSLTMNDYDAMMKVIDPSFGEGQSLSSGGDRTQTWVEHYGEKWEDIAKQISETIATKMNENLDPEALNTVMDTYFAQAVTLTEPTIEEFNRLLMEHNPGPISNEYREQLYQEYLETGTLSGAKYNEGLASELSNNSSKLRSAAQQSLDTAFASPFTVNAKVNINATYSGIKVPNTPTDEHASGGFVSGGPRLSWLAEEGWGEYIIPTNPSRRSEAMDLYERAGRALGVSEFAEGGFVSGSFLSDYAQDNNFLTDAYRNAPSTYNGIIEGNTEPVSIGKESSGPSVQVKVNMQPEFNFNGTNGQTEEEIVQALRRHMNELADELGGEIADKLGEVFSNMPVREA